MDRIIIFGAGNTGKRAYNEMKYAYNIVRFLDNNENKFNTMIDDVMVYNPDILKHDGVLFDRIIIATPYGEKEIKEQLRVLGIQDRQIDLYNDHDYYVYRNWLEHFKSQIIDFAEFELAEVGVYKGDFSRLINELFPNRILHLFDTFEGFDDRDIETEKKNKFSAAEELQFGDTSVEIVKNKMLFPDNVVFHKGYFPETAQTLSSTFALVRLDLDLYEPTRKGLDLFYDKMAPGGVILVHDYYGSAYKGIKDAVDEFLSQHNDLHKLPLGDLFSVVIGGF